MPMMDPALPEDAVRLARTRASVARQLDLMIDERGPVEQVKRLIADLDRISADLSQTLRETSPTAPRSNR